MCVRVCIGVYVCSVYAYRGLFISHHVPLTWKGINTSDVTHAGMKYKAYSRPVWQVLRTGSTRPTGLMNACIFLEWYCSTVQGLINWFEVDVWIHTSNGTYECM